MTGHVFAEGSAEQGSGGGGTTGQSGVSSIAVPVWLDKADRGSPWDHLTVCVAGIGVSGVAVARVLGDLGASVIVIDKATGESVSERAVTLRRQGIRVRLGDADTLPEGTGLVVTSPGWRPNAPLFAAARHAGVPVWGDIELAWRLRSAKNPAHWLCVTGTNGKTTTVQMLASILRTAGRRAIAAGNVGTPLIDVVLADGAYDVIAVELSSFQLHWTFSVRSHAAAVLNVAPDHLDWHGSLQEYAAAKGRIYDGCQVACVYNVADEWTERLVREADVAEDCRAVGFTLGTPRAGELGVIEGLLVDRAFVPDPQGSAVELGAVSDVRPYAPHNVANALAAAALARALGVSPEAVRDGLRAFRPDAHRIARVATIDGVDYVDDSKATNPHAAAASLAAYPAVVWVAGGLAKGATFDDLVRGARDALRGAILLGADRALILDALARHAPHLPVVDVPETDTGAMDRIVREAAVLARPGDTVLLAPACASMDMFTNYGERGNRFAEAVRRLAATRAEEPGA
jgi:UDP-N-acetylmuramoylalanine--D-glutamate ligase